jgi:hypothetical protein
METIDRPSLTALSWWNDGPSFQQMVITEMKTWGFSDEEMATLTKALRGMTGSFLHSNGQQFLEDLLKDRGVNEKDGKTCSYIVFELIRRNVSQEHLREREIQTFKEAWRAKTPHGNNHHFIAHLRVHLHTW